MMLDKKVLDFFVVHFAGHDVPLDHVRGLPLGVWETLFSKLVEPEQTAGEELEKGAFAVQINIEHSFGVVET